MVWYGDQSVQPNRHNRACWATVGGQRYYFKSALEVRYAAYLELLKMAGIIAWWLYEPQKFKFFGKDIEATKLAGKNYGVRVYTPDFKVQYPTHVEWHECKGALLQKDITKLRAFRTYYPNQILRLVMCGIPKGRTPKSAEKRARIWDCETRGIDIYDFADTWRKQVRRVFGALARCESP